MNLYKKLYIMVIGVTEHESEVKISKFKTVDAKGLFWTQTMKL